MNRPQSRRAFVRTLLAVAAGLSCPSRPACAVTQDAISFVLLGDLHFDRLSHHNLEWLQKEKPDDFRQVQSYSGLTAGIQPQLFATLRDTIVEQSQSPATRVAFVAQVGDFVEGLCGSEALASRQNTEAIEFVRDCRLGVPFLFTKGNHDITGPGAPEAFKAVFQPFLSEQGVGFLGGGKLTGANHAIEQGGALFCFFDAYESESLPWLEAVLARRTARHCFVILHPPIVPYGARSTWHLYSGEHDKEKREHLLGLLGKHNAFVLSGHIHKHSLLVRTTSRGGRFLQLAVSSVINELKVTPRHQLDGVASYNADQVKVEPQFSPATEVQRRAVYRGESPFVKAFQYADLPGYALVAIEGASVRARIYPGIGREVWRTLELTSLLDGSRPG